MLKVTDPHARIAAVLHDVVEDSDWTLEQLAAEGFDPAILAAVEALTRRDDEDYETFVRRAGRNAIARDVKLADIRDNLDISRISNPTERDHARLAKYRQAEAILVSNVTSPVCEHRARDHQYLGSDPQQGRFADVRLDRCRQCGARFLFYQFEFEYLTGSGRWYEGQLTSEQAAAVTVENAAAMLESLPSYTAGGSYFGGEIRSRAGRLA